VPANEKRARKKAARDERWARREAELRRRRIGRIAGLVAILVGIAVVAVFIVGGGDDEGGNRAGDGNKQANDAGAVEGPCDFGAEPPENNAKQYDAAPKPAEVLENGVDYAALIETNCGTIELDLLEKEAPQTVANFVFLAKEGYYDGLTWHRVINEFVIQGGDPQGDGSGGPGYQFEDELPAAPKVYTFGALAMANSGPNTNGSQFFIVTHDAEAALAGERDLAAAGLQALYSYFGQATEDSYETIDAIQKVKTSTDPATKDQPVEPVYMLSVTIEEQ
jgi:cyclophilin family peptidyl-prolyl cis-trans isomerase